MAHRRTRKPADGGDEIRQPAGTSWSPSMAGLVDRLSTAKVVQARPIMWGSNSTFLVTLEDPCAGRSHAIYKPRRGEAPLWDFPNGSLYRREVATYLVSESIGWSLVPPTVARDGPHGVGSMQLFIEHDPQTYFVSPAERDRAASEQIALLDWVLNNADRKSEHCIQDLAGRTWAIDHGLTFHVEPKLRTVIWDFAGEPISADLLTDLTEPAWGTQNVPADYGHRERSRRRDSASLQAATGAHAPRPWVRASPRALERLVALEAYAGNQIGARHTDMRAHRVAAGGGHHPLLY